MNEARLHISPCSVAQKLLKNKKKKCFIFLFASPYPWLGCIIIPSVKAFITKHFRNTVQFYSFIFNYVQKIRKWTEFTTNVTYVDFISKIVIILKLLRKCNGTIKLTRFIEETMLKPNEICTTFEQKVFYNIFCVSIFWFIITVKCSAIILSCKWKFHSGFAKIWRFY